jgi:ABC-type taurine transport system ATPase subunit
MINIAVVDEMAFTFAIILHGGAGRKRVGIAQGLSCVPEYHVVDVDKY